MEISPTGTIYLSAFDGKLFISKDNGITWEQKEIGNYAFHVGLSFASSNKLVMVNTDGQKAAQVVTIDTNIQVQKTVEYQFGMNDVKMVSEQTGYIAAYGTILKTTDGGENWVMLDIKNDNFNALSCRGENEIWVSGYNGSIFHTTNGGTTWDKLRNGNNIALPRYHLKDISFKDAANGWAVGEDGLIIYTNDGGNTWTRYNKFTDAALLDIAFSPDGTIILVGEAGAAYRLTP